MDTPDLTTSGKRIKWLREQRKLSGAELARRIQIRTPSLWALENKEGLEPSGRVLAGLCRELHTTCDFIMFGSGNDTTTEIDAIAAEIALSLRHMTPEGRTAVLLTARGLRQDAAGAAQRHNRPTVRAA